MLSSTERAQIKALMQREIIPAMGCTEPVAVALCTAKATEILGKKPERINVFLSANVVKNAMGVGIPGTGMIGLPIAIALGALIGKSEYELEVLKELRPESVEQAKLFINENRIDIQLKPDAPDILYIEVLCFADDEISLAIIQGNHTSFSRLEKNGEILLKKEVATDERSNDDIKLTFRTIYDYSIKAPLAELEFILEAAEMNKKASEESRYNTFGHDVAKNIRGETGKMLFGDNLHSRMVAATAGGCDVRMAGAMIPVMSNSGSGNQGIAATLPVVTFAENIGCGREELIRALTMSSLVIIYIKQYLGRLSALCGCVVASTGSGCAITYLMGGSYEQITYAAKNMIANITGMICDGAKPSCALKVASGVSTATLSALMAIENKVVTSQEGIIDDDIDTTIQNLGIIGKYGMLETDKIVLDIMTKK